MTVGGAEDDVGSDEQTQAAQLDTVAPSPPPRRGLSRYALPVGIVGVAVGCLVLWRDALNSGVFDDTFWHRAAGVWMLQHHRVITHDIFSYTVFGNSWRSPEWGYDVLLAESVRVLGPVAFWLLSAGVASVAVVAVTVRSRLVGAGWMWTGLLSLEAGVGMSLFLDDRPQVVSYLLLATLLLLFTLARRNAKWLWGVPVLFVVWVNMHGSFLLALAVVALELVLAYFPVHLGRVSVPHPLPKKPMLATFVGALVATLVNPFGPAVYQVALGVTFNSTIRQLIEEWQSPNFHDPSTLAVIVLPIAFTVGYLAFSKATLPAAELILVAFLLVMTLQAVRFLPYFAIAWCALAANCPPVAKEQLRPQLIVWPLLAILGVALLHGPWYPAGKPAASVPVRAVNYLEAHHGRVFSTYLWNDYLDWRGIRVFVDGRTELYTNTPVLDQYLALDNLTTEPDVILNEYRVRYVLWPPGSPLSIDLAHDTQWREVWRSKTAVIFSHVG